VKIAELVGGLQASTLFLKYWGFFERFHSVFNFTIS